MILLTWGIDEEMKDVQVQFRVNVSASELRRLAGAPDVVPLVEILSRAADRSLGDWIRWWWRRRPPVATEQTSDPQTDGSVLRP